MSKEEKNNVFEIATKIGEIIGKHGTNEEIELFELFLKDYKEKNIAYFREKEKNKKQAKHIKNINKRNEKQRMQLKLLQAHKLKKYMMDNYIRKEKIKEKIKELEQIKKKEEKTKFIYSCSVYNAVINAIDMLEELLEESNV